MKVKKDRWHEMTSCYEVGIYRASWWCNEVIVALHSYFELTYNNDSMASGLVYIMPIRNEDTDQGEPME